MQTPEEFALEVLPLPACCFEPMEEEVQWLADLIRARDEAIRADERGRCSAVHATLSDEALVAELVRRGVLTEVRVRDLPAVRIMLRDHIDAEPYLVHEESDDD